jgi:phosphatidylserine synthase
MPLAALGLVLVAAVVHASWNLLVKRSGQQQVFIGLASLIGSLCFLPFVFLYPAFPMSIWPYILASACLEVLYLRSRRFLAGLSHRPRGRARPALSLVDVLPP